MKHAKSPCISCPWRRDVPTGKFSADRFRALAHCAYDMARPIFACHMSDEGGEFACAGFLLQSAVHNLSVRMARQDFSHVLSRYPLFATYREMAIANGVDPDDPALRNCRDDGQWRKGMQDDPERHMPPMAQGTVKMLRDRGHTVAVRCNRNGSLRYTLDAERERTAFELSNRLRKLHGVG